MRISRVKIDNYGPLRDKYWDLDPGMTLFYGPNESGKTLVVESILKLLLNGQTSEIAGIDRVTSNPAGFLVVETDTGAIQLPDADFTDLFPDGTTRADIRNAFVIRDYDLRLPDRRRDFGHTSYYRDVTDRLLGAQTQKIDAVKEHIAEIGHLANKDSARLMNRSPVKLKDRYQAAQSVVAELESYLDQCQQENVIGMVRERRAKASALARTREDIKELEAAKQQQQLDTGRSLVQQLETIEAQISAHDEREAEITEYKELRHQIDSFRDGTANEEPSPQSYLYGIAVSSVLFLMTLVVAVVSPLSGMSLIAGAVLLIILYLGYQYYDARRRLGERYKLVQAANYRGVPGDDLPSVYQELESRINEYEAEREQLSNERSETIGKLKGVFNAAHASLEDWTDELASFAEQVPSVDRSFDPAELDELHQKESSLRESIESIRKDLQEHTDRLRDLDRELQEIRPEEYLQEIESIRVQSVADLRDAIDCLQQFMTEIETNREHALVAIEIFDGLEEEEEQAINQLFDGDSFLVSSFEDVTNGTYTDVWFDEEMGIRVTRADDREVSPFELSQGTYDLLYLTIRLTLATKLLDDEPGFLLLDDAFVHSDATRVAREAAILEDLAANGWQIMYFSFRKAIRDAIAASDTGSVIALDALSFHT